MNVADLRPLTTDQFKVGLIVFPDDFPIADWRKEVADMEPEANYYLPGHVDSPAQTFGVSITLPILRGASAEIARVYFACQGRIHFYLLTTQVRPLARKDLAGMAPLWAGLMRVGHPYLWLRPQPIDCPAWRVEETSLAVRAGWMKEGTEPIWL